MTRGRVRNKGTEEVLQGRSWEGKKSSYLKRDTHSSKLVNNVSPNLCRESAEEWGPGTEVWWCKEQERSARSSGTVSHITSKMPEIIQQLLSKPQVHCRP